MAAFAVVFDLLAVEGERKVAIMVFGQRDARGGGQGIPL